MKPFCLVIIVLLLAAFSFAQSSDDPDVARLDSLAKELDSLPDNATMIQALDSLSTTAPSDEGTILQLGQGNLSAGRIKEALAEFDKAVQLVPDDPQAQSLKGKSLMLLGRPTEALPSLTKAIELDPSLAEARFNRAAAYNIMSHPEAALQDLESAIASDPTLKTLARTSKYFQNLQSNPEFQKLVK
jgi:Flp pilus assembly protein TadD